jgi:hypothetical protein
MSKIWMIAENTAWMAVLAACAKSLQADADITAFVNGGEADARQGIALGAGAAFALPLPADAPWESYTRAGEKARAKSLRSFPEREQACATCGQLGALLDALLFRREDLALSADAFPRNLVTARGRGPFQTAARTVATVAASLRPGRRRSARQVGVSPGRGPGRGHRPSPNSAEREPDDAARWSASAARERTEVHRGDRALAKVSARRWPVRGPSPNSSSGSPRNAHRHFGQQITQLFGGHFRQRRITGVRDAKIIVSITRRGSVLNKKPTTIVGDGKGGASLIQAWPRSRCGNREEGPVAGRIAPARPC